MKKKRHIWAIGLIGVPMLLLVGGFFFCYYIYRVEPAFSQRTYELGQGISENIGDYLIGNKWALNRAELDLSGVDEETIGTYVAIVRHGDKEYAYSVEIRDTIAPKLQLKEEQVCFARNREYEPKSVVADMEDADAHATVYFEVDGLLLKKISFSQIGKKTLRVVARDCSGNEAVGETEVLVDEAPMIEGVRRFYLAPGSEPDYLASVVAWDETDGNLTGQIKVEDSAVKLATEGEYILRYEVEDSYGLTTSVETGVKVAKPEELQELIGARQIACGVDVIEGAPNAHDMGASAEEDLEGALLAARPAFVHLYHDVGQGGYNSGSGYIMEITEDKIYICTNRHVVTQFDSWDIYFYDGTVASGRTMGAAAGYDVGVAVVETEDVEEELLMELRTVHIDKAYWQTLDEDPIDVGLERPDREGGILHTARGELIKIKQSFEWNNSLDHTEVTVELVHGDSGSAVVDGYGNLICMAYAYSTNPVRYWCIPLDEILTGYQQITGREPYVYE